MTILLFSFFDIFRYWDTITQYLNPLTIIIWAVVGGLIGFLIAFLLEIILRKKILVQRQHWTLKWLSYLYLVFFPLFTGFCFTQWFTLHAFEKEIVKNIPTYMNDANAVFNLYLKDEVVKVVDRKHFELTGHELVNKTVLYSGAAAGTLLAESNLVDSTVTAKASSFLLEKFSDNDYIKEQAVKYVEGAVGEQLLMDKNLTSELLDVKVSNILSDGVLNVIIEKYVRELFGGLKIKVLLVFLLIMLVPIAEILLAHYLERRKAKLSLKAMDIATPQRVSTNFTEANQENN